MNPNVHDTDLYHTSYIDPQRLLLTLGRIHRCDFRLVLWERVTLHQSEPDVVIVWHNQAYASSQVFFISAF